MRANEPKGIGAVSAGVVIAIVIISGAVAVVATVLLLTGCATAPQAPATAISCIPLVNYSASREQAAAAALAALPADSPLVGFMTDYGAMRAADRACLSKGN